MKTASTLMPAVFSRLCIHSILVLGHPACLLEYTTPSHQLPPAGCMALAACASCCQGRTESANHVYLDGVAVLLTMRHAASQI